jgi:hypothetical protein
MKGENGAFVIIKTSEEHELDIKLNEDYPRIAIPVNLKDQIKRISEEDMMKEKCCHDRAMGTLNDFLEDNMLDGDFFLKTEIKKKRNLFNGKKLYVEKKEVFENFYKTNI